MRKQKTKPIETLLGSYTVPILQIGNNLKTTADPYDSSAKHHDHHCPSGEEGQNTLASKAGNMGSDSSIHHLGRTLT